MSRIKMLFLAVGIKTKTNAPEITISLTSEAGDTDAFFQRRAVFIF